jgi:hypothetical protein
MVAVMISAAYLAAVYALNTDELVTLLLCALAIISCVLPEFLRTRCSQRFDELVGNRSYPPASSFLETWAAHLQLRIPEQLVLHHPHYASVTSAEDVNPYGFVERDSTTPDRSAGGLRASSIY